MRSLKHYMHLLVLLCLILTAGCKKNVVFQEQQSISSKGWHYQDERVFEVHIHDTLSLHQMYLDLRNTTDYPYRNLFLFLDIEFPDSRVLRDTIECILADRRGGWTGSGFGSVRANRFLFRDDVWFPVEGVYRFTIIHGMRYDTLQGISDVGIRIEKKY
ncbi:MAG: gliding motility lipoprotein GldH [Bacteroidia bacterium]|nr:MAG: gliding motility lipoprotein GldH [Bacteroidia bacterium]